MYSKKCSFDDLKALSAAVVQDVAALSAIPMHRLAGRSERARMNVTHRRSQKGLCPQPCLR
jgi:hypothetical protein